MNDIDWVVVPLSVWCLYVVFLALKEKWKHR